MPSLYTAGQKIRASELNRFPQTYRITTDTTVNNTTTYANATGLAFAGEANGIYLVELMVCYRSGSTPGVKFCWSIPAGMTGWWGLQSVTGSSRIGNFDSSAFVDDWTANFGASGDSSLHQLVSPKGVAIFGATAGTMQFRFAQSTANASNTTIKSGSVMRVTQLT